MNFHYKSLLSFIAVSCMQIVVMTCILLNGFVTEPLGRKKSLILGQAIILTGWMALYSAHNFYFLLAGRCFMGIGVGILYPVTCNYISEIALVRFYTVL